MTQKYKSALAAILLAGASVPAMAVPARPGTFTRTQPDGTQLTLSIHGDEHFNYLTDSEGYIVSRQADGWYRILDNSGQATSLTPMPAEMRSAADRTELSAIDPVQTFETLKTRSLGDNLRAQVSKAPAMYRAGSVPAGKWDNSDGHDLRAIPTDGERHVLVILVNFSNLKWSFADDPQAEMKAMLNEPGYSRNHCTGSAADFFHASSNGIYQPIFDVYGPVDLPKPYSYYGRNDSHGNDAAVDEMVAEACKMLDDSVDFSIYDTNGDGYVDNVYVFYAGYGANEGAGDDFIWPHAFNLRYTMTPPKLDGVMIDHYACSNEITMRSIDGNLRTHSGIGTFCHEFSHVLGLPDVYATDYTGAFTPGSYCVMDNGSYNNNARTPPLYSIYEKYALEWEKPIDITEGADINMQPTVDGGHAYRVTIDPSRPTEYYLFENRQQHSWDKFIPGHGMMVWHVDFDKNIWATNVVNNKPEHQHLDLVEADGTADEGSQAGDLFPGTACRNDFTAKAEKPYPGFVNWNGKASPLDITNIGEDVTGTVSLRFGDGGSPDSPLYAAAPEAVLTGVDDTSLSFRWEKVPGAKKYYITALSMRADDLFGTLETELVDRYTFADLGDATSVTLTDLTPGLSYQISLYAATDNNLSPASQGFYSTYDSELTDIEPLLNVTPGADTATLNWYEVPGADHYEVTVATRTEGTPEPGATVTWDNKRYPSDWSFPGGMFDSRDEYSGQSAPSLRMSNETAITTGIYDKDIDTLEFWARADTDGGNMSLKIYSVEPNFSLYQIGEITRLPCTRQGERVRISDIPTGVRQLMIVYTCRTAGMTINIDDIDISYAGETADTPVGPYDAYRVEGTTLRAEGLQPLTSYVAYMRAVGKAGNSALSKVVKFKTSDSAGAGEIADSTPGFTMTDGVVRAEAPVSIFAIDGTPVAIRTTGAVQLPARGVYLITTAGKTSKIAW